MIENPSIDFSIQKSAPSKTSLDFLKLAQISKQQRISLGRDKSQMKIGKKAILRSQTTRLIEDVKTYVSKNDSFFKASGVEEWTIDLYDKCYDQEKIDKWLETKIEL